MNEFTPEDLDEVRKHKRRYNYLGEYHPDKFWHELGKKYANTFSMKDEDKNSLKINLGGMIARIKLAKVKTVLEVGCGFGRCLPFVACNVPSLERIVGLEMSDTMIAESPKYLNMFEKRDKIKIVQGRAQELPFKDKEFDLIYTHVCLTHIPPEDIPQVTKEISRVAKNWIIHVERFRFLYEHPTQHRWSHLLAPYYMDKGWEVWDSDVINEEHFTNVLVVRR